MSHSSVCWQCGASISELTLPLSRFDACRQCRAQLHVCRQCSLYDVTVARQCREPIAEDVPDKQRGNICDYFVLRHDAYKPHNVVAVQQARSQLDSLFGVASHTASSADDAATFDSTSASDASKQASVRAELDALFGKKT
jgi:hypothetical protein